jgi:hypothetical protein
MDLPFQCIEISILKYTFHIGRNALVIKTKDRSVYKVTLVIIDFLAMGQMVCFTTSFF